MPHAPTDPELIAAAAGRVPADLALVGGRVLNVFTRRVEEATVLVKNQRIAAVLGPEQPHEADQMVELAGSVICPGLLDAHMHVESTMLPPREFVRLALPHGTVGAVFDPHEIANVLGIEGIRWVMDDAEGLPFEAMFGASSCVPSSPLETSGAALSAEDIEPLFEDPRVVTLAEMMNFPGVVHADPGVLAKIDLGLSRRMVDGHSPGLHGRALQAYVAAGVGSDHECTMAEEAEAKLALGMQIFIREGSAARNLEALLPLVTPENAHRFCLCTDDRHPGDLRDDGHIDHAIRRAIGLGMDPVLAVSMGSLHTASHYRRTDLGAIAPGFLAHLVVVDSLEDFRPKRVYIHGRPVAEHGRCVWERPSTRAKPPRGTVRVPELTTDSLRVPVTREGAMIRVIGMDPHQIVTASLTLSGVARDGTYVADANTDLAKLAVIERHHETGNIGLGFVHGFGMRHGALGSTVGHDSHNLTVVGVDDEDMLLAARTLGECGGGQCVVRDGRVLSLLPLPIAGLMSDQPAQDVIAKQATLLQAAASLGIPHHDPFMPLSFLPLPVIPSLKLTDRGLVDVERFEIVPLEVEP